jgi:LysR family glycine cleavage system transcriptional activator
MDGWVPGTRALRTLVAAGRHLNFTRAADTLGLTPAAVSHQIKEIEDQLGVTLFTRTSRTIRLTEAGTLLLEASSESLDLLARAVAQARRAQRGVSMLRLTLESTCASRWLLPRLSGFRRLHPDMQVRLDVTDELRDFDLDDIDAGIRFGSGRYPGLAATRLFDNVVVPVCSPALLAGEFPIREPSDLFNHTLCHVLWSMEGATWPSWRVWMAAAGIDNFDESNCIAFNDSSHSIQAALDGNAVALVDLALVADDLKSGRLVCPFDLGIRMEPQFAYYFVYPQRSAEDARVVALRDWLLDEARRTDEQSLVVSDVSRQAVPPARR